MQVQRNSESDVVQNSFRHKTKCRDQFFCVGRKAIQCICNFLYLICKTLVAPLCVKAVVHWFAVSIKEEDIQKTCVKKVCHLEMWKRVTVAANVTQWVLCTIIITKYYHVLATIGFNFYSSCLLKAFWPTLINKQCTVLVDEAELGCCVSDQQQAAYVTEHTNDEVDFISSPKPWTWPLCIYTNLLNQSVWFTLCNHLHVYKLQLLNFIFTYISRN